jgi:hypothetical protein
MLPQRSECWSVFLDQWIVTQLSNSLLGVLHVLAWAKKTLWTLQCLSVCLSRFSYEVGNLHDRGSLLQHFAQQLEGGNRWNTWRNSDLG